jgi:imidazolonepropionase-like amidohydrolase
MKTRKHIISNAVFFCIFIFSTPVFAANTLTLYDDFNENTLHAEKWLVEPSENAGAMTVDNGTLKIHGEFYQGQGVQSFLLGPDKSFDALEAKIKLSSATELVQGFGIGLSLWSNGFYDYKVAIYFSRLTQNDPLKIAGYVDALHWQANPFSTAGEVFTESTAYDTWYRVRIERDGTNIHFYVKEGTDAFDQIDLKYTYAIQGTIESPSLNLAFLDARNLIFYETAPLAGFVDDVFVGNTRSAYTISGKIDGTLCDNATIALYEGAFPRETRKVNADGTYAFRFLSDQKTYIVGSANLCCQLEPATRTVTIQGADQTDVNFTVKPDNASSETVYAITGGRLIDGNGGKPVNNALIIVRGGTIQSVSRAGETEIPSGAQMIDAAGKTIIPGLHDMHVHILGDSSPFFYPDYVRAVGVDYRKNLYGYLFCGVTSVLDVGEFTAEDVILRLREQEQAHCLVSPRIFTVGAGITYPHGYGFPARVASNSAEAVKVVDDLAKKKPDMVKLLYEDTSPTREPIPAFDTGTLQALIDESRRKGLKTTVHVRTPEQAETVAPLQPDAFAHIPGWFGSRKYEKEMIKYHISCTPTLMASGMARTMFLRNPELINDDFIKSCIDPRLAGAYKDPALLEFARKSRTFIGRIMSTVFSFPQRFGALRRLYRAGNKIIMGTDAANPAIFHGPAAHEELGLYVKAGLTPLQAITTATRNGAEYVGKLDRQGTIEAGKLADLVILKANPLLNISNTKKIALVMKDGKIMDRGMLSRDITGRLCEEARYIADRIDLMPASAFKDSDTANKAALTGMLEGVYSILKKADDNETSQQNYAQASQMLSTDVVPLLDGCANDSAGDDLITDCAYQKEVYAAAQQLVEDCLSK